LVERAAADEGTVKPAAARGGGPQNRETIPSNSCGAGSDQVQCLSRMPPALGGGGIPIIGGSHKGDRTRLPASVGGCRIDWCVLRQIRNSDKLPPQLLPSVQWRPPGFYILCFVARSGQLCCRRKIEMSPGVQSRDDTPWRRTRPLDPCGEVSIVFDCLMGSG
jgi:hypothetical protein